MAYFLQISSTNKIAKNTTDKTFIDIDEDLSRIFRNSPRRNFKIKHRCGQATRTTAPPPLLKKFGYATG